jgi:SH3 domain protein
MNMLKPLLISLAIALPLNALADTRYVTDEIKITLRSGESPSHRILRMLPTGTAVNVLSSDADNGYSHVRVGNTEGYVLTRQLLRERPARDQLAALQARVAQLTQTPDKLRLQLDDLTKRHQQLTAEHKKMMAEKQTVEQNYATLQRTAADAVQIANERDALRKQVADLTRETADLKLRTQELENNNLQRWFLTGAGVVVGGILLGLILPNLKLRRRRSGWDSL